MLHHLKPYVSFVTVEEMDLNIRHHIQAHTLTKSQLAILYCIAQHALATPGVAHLKAETIAKKCHISSKTVYRSVKELQLLGIVKKVKTTKLNGITAANIYILNRYVPAEMSERQDVKTPSAANADAVKSSDESISFESKKSSKEVYCHENEFHDRLLTHFNYFPLRQPFKQQLLDIIPKLVVHTQSQYERAKRVIIECIYLVANQQITLYSTFENFVLGAYKKWTFKEEQVQEQAAKISTRPVPFYNWLEERA